MLKAGKLRHRVVIQRPVETQNSTTGATTVTWQDVATVWAAIEPLSAREFIAAQAENSKVSTRITVRYRADLTHEMRLYHAAKDKIYNIEGVLSDKESGLEYLTLPCSEGVRYEQQPADVLPVLLEYPEIEGDAGVGDTVSATNGLWANDPTSYLYQWYLNDVAIIGETSQTLEVPDNVGDILTIGVKAVNTAGETAEAISDGVLIIA